jgi:hypothetical protein
MVPQGSATCLLARSFPVSCGNGEVTGRTHIFFGHINREPLAPLAAIQGEAGMVLSLGTRPGSSYGCRGALPQAQGSGRNRRKLLHLVMEPSDRVLGSFSHVCKSFCLYTNTGARDSWQSVPCKETSALSAKRWFKARNWQRSANLKDL